MTTAQPPLKPGDRVYVEVEVIRLFDPENGPLRFRPVNPDTTDPLGGIFLNPERHRWHPMPGPTSPDPDAAARFAEAADTLGELAVLFDVLGQPLSAIVGEARALVREYGMALGELDRMRPVVAAALEWQAHRHRNEIAAKATAAVALWEAVDAYRAGQKAPETAPGATLSHERPEDRPSDGSAHSEAQKAAEAFEPERCRHTDRDLFTNRPMRCIAHRLHHGPHRFAFDDEPADDRTQPADAPAPRDWAGEIGQWLYRRGLCVESHAIAEHVAWLGEDLVVALRLHELEDERDGHRFRAEMFKDQIRGWAAKVTVIEAERDEAKRSRCDLVERVRRDAFALNIHGHPGEDLFDGLLRIITELRRERDDLRERAEHYQRERDEAIGERQAEHRAAFANAETLAKTLAALTAAETGRDEAAGKLDALRAGVAKEADALWAADPLWRYGYRTHASRLRALLDAATTDGTTTAETTHRAGCVCAECEDASDNDN